jgi:hypothetical protein
VIRRGPATQPCVKGGLAAAQAFFARAIAADSMSYDAVAGSGMAAYRAGEPTAARRSVERALLEPQSRPQRKRIRLVITTTGLSGAGNVGVTPRSAELVGRAEPISRSQRGSLGAA